MYSPPVMPNNIIPIHAAETWPVPTWKTNTTISTITCLQNYHFKIECSSVQCAYHGVYICLLLSILDGDEKGLLIVTALHSGVEIHNVSVVVVVADVVVLPPAWVGAAVRS